MSNGARPLSRGTLLRRVAGMLVGYYLHAWLANRGDVAAAAAPAASHLVTALLPLALAALLAGYAATLVSGGSTRTARLLGIALAAIAILATIQRLEQGLPPVAGHVAQIVTSPLCVAGGALLERHRTLWLRRVP